MNKESFLTQRREIITSTLEEVMNSLSFSELDSRVKRTKPSLEYLLHSMTYYFSYAQILKFNAGVVDLSESTPADGLLELSWTFQSRGQIYYGTMTESAKIDVYA